MKVSILAAVFDDKTGIGDERLVNEALETRRRVKKHLERFRKALRDVLGSPDSDSLAAVQKLNDELDDLIEDSPANPGPVRLASVKPDSKPEMNSKR